MKLESNLFCVVCGGTRESETLTLDKGDFICGKCWKDLYVKVYDEKKFITYASIRRKLGLTKDV